MELTIEQALQQGIAAHKEGKLQDAERLYRTILQSQPLNPDANHNLGILAVSVNKADAALPLFKTALKANPKIEQIWLSYIDALIKEQHFEAAKQLLEQAKYQGVTGEKLNVLAAQLASINKEESVDGLNPSQQKYSNLLEHYQNGRFSEAEKLATSISQEFPQYQFAWKVLGAVLKQTGRVTESVTAMQKSVQLAPQDAEAHSNLGVTLQELGRLDEAEASYRQAISLKSDYAEAHSNLGVTLKELGRLEEALASYTQAIALKPDYAVAYGNLGLTLKELGRLDEAEASYKQAIALKPDYAEAHNNLGITLKELGRLDEAKASYKQAIALKTDYVDCARNFVRLPVGQLDSDTLDLCEKIFCVPGNALENNIRYFFFRGNLLKHRGLMEQSFNNFCKANKLKLEDSKNKILVESKKNIDHLMRIKKWVPSIPDLTRDRLTKIFIMGPSRSGKSYAEHVLRDNSHVKTLFEACSNTKIFKNDYYEKDLGKSLFQNLFSQSEAQLLNQQYEVVTSTNPGNIFYSDYLIDMLPNTYFIIVKRDPRDISPEIFTQEYLLQNIYSYDPHHISKYLDVYDEICETLSSKVPDRFLTVNFEEIIKTPADFADQVSKLVDIKFGVKHIKRNIGSFKSESAFRNYYADMNKKKQAEANNANITNPSQSELTNLVEHFKAGRYDDVEKYAIPLTQKFPNHQFSWKVLGAVFRQTGRKYKALSANQKAVEVMPQDAEAHFNLGLIFKEIDRLEEAEVSYRQAITLKPDFTSALNNLGLMLQELGRLEDSELNLKQAINLKPDFSEAHSNLGITLKKMGRLEKAEASYKKAIALKPDFSEAHNHLGFILKEMGRLEEAETSLTQAIAIKHNFYEAHNNLGITLKEMDKLEKAEASFRQAIALKSDYADAYNNLGITLTELDRLEEAELNLKQAIALEPNFSGAHYNLSIVHYNIGDKDLALKSVEKANKIDPHSKDFKLLLRVIQSKKYKKESKSLVGQTNDIATFKGLDSNPLILNRIVEAELITNIYAMASREMDKTIDARFGSGKCSLDFNLFEDNHSIIKILAEDLKTIMMEAVKSDVYIFDSFFNILGAGGGTTPHDHLNELDKDIGLDLGKQKYSLVYYLSVGDQNCSEPGTLKLYDPDEGILPSEGMITIIPASRKHSAIYGGNIDRVMIGVNFYSL